MARRTRPRRWRAHSVEVLFRHRLFSLERQQLGVDPDPDGEASSPAEGEAEGGADARPARREAMVLRAPDWVNVIAFDTEDRVLLVRQWRYGTASTTLEIPGGMVDPDEIALAAAQRELLEETGYRAAAWSELGVVEPNPAFLSNRCTTFLARGAEWVGEAEGDGEEELELVTARLEEIPGRIAGGEIRHALVIAAFHWLALRAAQAAPVPPSSR